MHSKEHAAEQLPVLALSNTLPKYFSCRDIK